MPRWFEPVRSDDGEGKSPTEFLPHCRNADGTDTPLGAGRAAGTITSPKPRSNAMLEALVRFIEELIDVLNFGNTISK